MVLVTILPPLAIITPLKFVSDPLPTSPPFIAPIFPPEPIELAEIVYSSPGIRVASLTLPACGLP